MTTLNWNTQVGNAVLTFISIFFAHYISILDLLENDKRVTGDQPKIKIVFGFVGFSVEFFVRKIFSVEKNLLHINCCYFCWEK